MELLWQIPRSRRQSGPGLRRSSTRFSAVAQQAVPRALVLVPFDMASNFQKIRQLCGSRSCGTVLKRANDLLKFCWWYKKFYYQKEPFPLRSSDIAEYVWERHQDSATFSALRSITECVNFAVYVLGMSTMNQGQPLIDPFTKGVLDKSSMNRPGRKQARPSTVKEVMHLESCLRDTSMNLFDRFAAGTFLFAIFARCRWSDMRCVDSFELRWLGMDCRSLW